MATRTPRRAWRRLGAGSAVAAALGLGLLWWSVESRTPGARAGEVIILVSTEPGLRSLRDLLHDDALSLRLESLLRDQPIWRIHSDERALAGEFTHFFEFAPRARRTSRVMQLVVDAHGSEAGIFEAAETEIRWRTMPLGRSAPLISDRNELAYLRSVLSDPETFGVLLIALRQDPPIALSDVFILGDGAGQEAAGVQEEPGAALLQEEELTVGERIVAYFTFVHPSGHDLAPLYFVETSDGETRLMIPSWLERLR